MTTLWNLLLLFAAEARFGSPFTGNDHSLEPFASFCGRGVFGSPLIGNDHSLERFASFCGRGEVRFSFNW